MAAGLRRANRHGVDLSCLRWFFLYRRHRLSRAPAGDRDAPFPHCLVLHGRAGARRAATIPHLENLRALAELGRDPGLRRLGLTFGWRSSRPGGLRPLFAGAALAQHRPGSSWTRPDGRAHPPRRLGRRPGDPRQPIAVARAVMERTLCTSCSSARLLRFASDHGFARSATRRYYNPTRPPWRRRPACCPRTVGCVALTGPPDRCRRPLAAGVSTSCPAVSATGRSSARPMADDRVSVSCKRPGEYFHPLVGAPQVASRMLFGDARCSPPARRLDDVKAWAALWVIAVDREAMWPSLQLRVLNLRPAGYGRSSRTRPESLAIGSKAPICYGSRAIRNLVTRVRHA